MVRVRSEGVTREPDCLGFWGLDVGLFPSLSSLFTLGSLSFLRLALPLRSLSSFPACSFPLLRLSPLSSLDLSFLGGFASWRETLFFLLYPPKSSQPKSRPDDRRLRRETSIRLILKSRKIRSRSDLNVDDFLPDPGSWTTLPFSSNQSLVFWSPAH